MAGERNIRDESPEESGTGSFASRLRSLRKAAGLTQEELALRADLSPKAVSALERGERKRPNPHTVRPLANALGLPEEERATLLAVARRPRTRLELDEQWAWTEAWTEGRAMTTGEAVEYALRADATRGDPVSL